MNVRHDIQKYAAEEDKEILLWLFDKYHWEWQWRFVAKSTYDRSGKPKPYWEIPIIWKPTKEGYALFEQLHDKP